MYSTSILLTSSHAHIRALQIAGMCGKFGAMLNSNGSFHPTKHADNAALQHHAGKGSTHGCAHLLELPFAALMSSSAKHSAMVLTLRNAASRAPVVSSQMAWFTRRRGEISTACLRTTPALPMRVASSLGPLRRTHTKGQTVMSRSRVKSEHYI